MLFKSQDVPPGYEPVGLGGGFGSVLGQAFVDRAARKLAFRVAASHSNPSGVCHGGAMSTFADAQILAVRPEAGHPASPTPTISLSVDFLAPVPVGALVEADVTLVKTTRTMIFTQAVMTVDGAAVARSAAIYRLTSNQERKS